MKNIILFLWGLSIFTGFPARAAYKWSSNERVLYGRRKFIELEQDLAQRGQSKLLHDMQKQQDDLAGCRALHDGHGGAGEFSKCLRFAGREHQLDLFSPGRAALIEDLNDLCPKLIADKKTIEVLSKTNLKTTLSGKVWGPCLSSIWKQVYLTAYANFDADPVGTVAFVRRVQSSIPSDLQWKKQTFRLLQVH